MASLKEPCLVGFCFKWRCKVAVVQHRRVYCKNSPCDYEGNIWDTGTPTEYDRSVATCPKCGFKMLYHIEVRVSEALAEYLEKNPITGLNLGTLDGGEDVKIKWEDSDD